MKTLRLHKPRTAWLPKGLLRHPRWDALFLGLALIHGVALIRAPSIPLIALGLWWDANTIAHNFIHQPFFRVRWGNRIFSAYLSLVLGLPQTLWRDRHLAHHAGVPWRWRWSLPLIVELTLVVGLWGSLLAWAPRFFVTVYLPGFCAGLGLCWLQGHYEHARGITSHYGRLYNWLFFNDGYHVEHHARMGEHWTHLPRYANANGNTSRWPAVLRWMETFPVNGLLNWLERLVLRSRMLQRFMLRRHERAFRALLSKLPEIRRVEIVGGGLHPRTALILRQLLPQAKLVLIDRDPRNLQTARAFVNGEVEYRCAEFSSAGRTDPDLVVIPLSYQGDRTALYRNPPAPVVLIHDWIWSAHGKGVIVSRLLLKRLNCVYRQDR